MKANANDLSQRSTAFHLPHPITTSVHMNSLTSNKSIHSYTSLWPTHNPDTLGPSNHGSPVVTEWSPGSIIQNIRLSTKLSLSHISSLVTCHYIPVSPICISLELPHSFKTPRFLIHLSPWSTLQGFKTLPMSLQIILHVQVQMPHAFWILSRLFQTLLLQVSACLLHFSPISIVAPLLTVSLIVVDLFISG